VQSIKAVLFEPVGCLAEFSAQEFDGAAAELFAAAAEAGASGSQAYWRLLNLIGRNPPSPDSFARLQAFELRAVEQAELYEDVRPALEALRTLGVAAHLASSLSRAAVARFIERHALSDLFAGIVSRDDAGGVTAAVLRHALERVGLAPAHLMVLTDTADGLGLCKELGLNGMLMINDYDEGRALAERGPVGGIVSLTELADALRLIEQRAGIRAPSRAPRAPFELFDPS
jgi:beta-phosphoglucomutase-like phosphatase (HAD superfamily)